MTESRRTFLGGAGLIELALLVLGILLAFGLEAWWANRSQQLELRGELENVLVEFDSNRQLIEQYLGWHDRSAAGTSALIDLLESAGPRSIEIPDSLIWDVGFTPTYDPRTGALGALLTSGRFGLIADAELRGALAGFDGYLRDARDEEMRARAYTDSQVVTALVGSGDVSRALYCMECRDEGHPPGLSTWLENSPELRTHLKRRLVFALLSIESLQAVRAEIDRIIRLTRSVIE